MAHIATKHLLDAVLQLAAPLALSAGQAVIAGGLKRNKVTAEAVEFNKRKLRENEIKLEEINHKIGKLETELKVQEIELDNDIFVDARKDENVKIVLNIGPTGFGKSLACNRLIGNTNKISNIEEKGEFEIAEFGDCESKTKDFKMKCKDNICFVDTPGQYDSNGNDKFIYNQMAKYFQGCGGVNLFCIYFKFGGKLDSTYKELLEAYQHFWGKGMWEYCCVIITFVDKPDKYRKKIDKLKEKFMEFLNKISNNKCNDIIFYEFGKRKFRESVTKIHKRMSASSTKYICKNINSPVNKIIAELQTQKKIRALIMDEISQLKAYIKKYDKF